MAQHAGLSAVGKSIERLLGVCFREDDPVGAGGTTKAILVRTEDFDKANLSTAIGTPALSIFFYRVDFNKTMRAAWSSVAHVEGRVHLPLDLHFLITPWALNAEDELRILGRAMDCLEQHPILSGPLLHPSGGFAPNETLQLVLEDVPTEAVMRTFDSLPTEYKLSVPYIARVARIDARDRVVLPSVTTVVSGATPGGPVPVPDRPQ